MKKVLFTVSLLMLGLFLLTSCEKREDFPTAIEITEPPQPFNVQVDQNSPTTYTLTWEIDDPSLVVSVYNVYLFSGFTPPELVGTTDELQTDINTVIPLEGLIFGVSSVTVENVESNLTSVAAPD